MSLDLAFFLILFLLVNLFILDLVDYLIFCVDDKELLLECKNSLRDLFLYFYFFHFFYLGLGDFLANLFLYLS